MFCYSCKLDKLFTDFINSDNICYKCLYLIKIEKITQKGTVKHQRCRICQNIFEQKKNLKKRQRTVFCSSACAEIGHKIQINNHWTRKIQI